MCVIVSKPIGVTMDSALLSELWDANKDGAGYLAKGQDGQWVLRKGIMEKAEFLEATSKFLKEDSHLIAHMRIRTKGSISPEFTHPFNWTKPGSDTSRYLFHNGTVKCLTPLLGSDSSFLADTLLSPVKTEEGHSILKNLSENGAGRFVTLVGDEVKIFGDDESVTKDGIWFSNGRHLAKKTTTIYTPQHQSNRHVHTVSKTTSHVISPPPIKCDDPNRLSLITKIAAFYAGRRQVLCNDAFIHNWSQENEIDVFNTAVLEQVATFCDMHQDNPDMTDPFFEFLLALQ